MASFLLPFGVSFTIFAVFFSAVPLSCISHAARAVTNDTHVRIPLIVDLIHRDSPQSPYYNASLTPIERFAQAAYRSRARARYMAQLLSQQATPEAIAPVLVSLESTYMVYLKIGNPWYRQFFIIDTGSTLTWSLCKPCRPERCDNPREPLYDPSKSSSAVLFTCPSDDCPLDESTYHVECLAGNCHYKMVYVDRSFTSGVIGRETITFESTPFDFVTFGCVTDYQGFGKHTGGLLGLGNGPRGIVRHPKMEQKFATCLPPYREAEAAGRLLIGETGEGPDTISVPMVDPDLQYYRAAISAAYVGDYPGTKTEGSFIVFVDSGTTYSLLPDEFLQELEGHVHDNLGLDRVPSPYPGIYHYCYETIPGMGIWDLPFLRFEFAGPVNVTLPPQTAFRLVYGHDIVCLTFLPAGVYGYDVPIIWAADVMANFLVGYDLAAGMLHFTPKECGSYGDS